LKIIAILSSAKKNYNTSSMSDLSIKEFTNQLFQIWPIAKH
jgi:hypothetical protein